jgi:uncharacterized membrane protein
MIIILLLLLLLLLLITIIIIIIIIIMRQTSQINKYTGKSTRKRNQERRFWSPLNWHWTEAARGPFIINAEAAAT